MATVDTVQKWREAVSYLSSTDYFGTGIVVEVRDLIAECHVLDKDTATDITPNTATLEAALDSAHVVIATENNISTAKGDIKELADKADNHATRIALCFAAILESENLAEDANATFSRITTALNDASVSNGYRTAVMTAFTAKTGLVFDLGNLGVVVLATKYAFNEFSASFFTRWAMMVNLRP
jgi:hypothetical protein